MRVPRRVAPSWRPPSPTDLSRPPASFPAAMGLPGAILLVAWAVAAYAGDKTNCEADCSGHGDCDLATGQVGLAPQAQPPPVC